ncbi:MAG: DEAD/DEAH box helicase family protein, partial [Gammaproteobacteria bacterium]|nr:DEAD/DEAH box helicase family protein [Gammaproteobacteria bacterium]
MEEQNFNINPILNSPYKEPEESWLLGDDGLPTGIISGGRRPSRILIPIPKATAYRRQKKQYQLDLQVDAEQEKDNSNVNLLRDELKKWRQKPLEDRGISSITVRLLRHWYEGKVSPRPFFCQIEAVETFIWLNEIAPKINKNAIKQLLQDIADANGEANMGLPRLAAKMATGAGKTTVMAMMIAYHAINKARNPKSTRYSNQFLIITPGITIKDRLRVLLPQDPNNYYEDKNIVPRDMLNEVKKAIVIITNYHAFRRREKIEWSKHQREVIQGNSKTEIDTRETEGQMLLRVCPELLRRQDNVIIINDEAHHCYIHKQDDEEDIAPEEKEEAKRNTEAARLWINGINALRAKIPIKTVYDLSATPFFLRGSGYPEGTLFQWVVSDFSLMDAIESGIVKLPRVPITDITTTENKLPIYRNLYQHIRKNLPKSGRGKQAHMNPEDLPSQLRGALEALYSHYKIVHEAWQKAGLDIPPAFIIVCNNTSTSKLVYDLVSGYEKTAGHWKHGLLDLFNNVNTKGDGLLHRPRTLLVDSYQLESGEALTDDFKKAAAVEIELFKEELRIRSPERNGDKITDEELLREVMNTIGKKDRLGEQIRCVVSVSMLTEGWDTNNVTHILGVRAFGTQLLCEQVVGRGLRRFSYDIEEEGEHKGKFLPEYADVFGVPFKFVNGDNPPPPPPPPPPQTRVRHLDERANLEIVFPRVRGYRIKPPEEHLTARFNSDSRLTIEPEMAPPATEQQGIVGEGLVLKLDDLQKHRINEVVFFLAAYIAERYYKTKEGAIAPARFRDLVPIVRYWLQHYVTCLYGTCKQYLLWHNIATLAAERIDRACAPKEEKSNKLLPVLDPFTTEGGTSYVDFFTRKKRLHETHPNKSHINIAVCDSDWEMWFCELLEATKGVFAYVRNDGLGFEIPYTHQKKEHNYLPDYIVLIDAGHTDRLNLVVEVKGYRDGRAQAKADTMKNLWIPAINNDGRWGRWAFEEIMDPQHLNMELIEQSKTPEQILAKYID